MQPQLLHLASAFVLMSFGWAVIALAFQIVRARAGGRTDYAAPAGRAARGLTYAFTTAMLPAHKETIRLHPAKFAVGVLMHLGVIGVLLSVVLSVARPAAGHALLTWIRPLLAVSLLAGIYLLMRRVFSINLKAMSAPDDFVAVLSTCVLLACGLFCPGSAQGEFVLLVYAGLFLFYLPLGKLRHAVFFFVARADQGRRLGLRGVYPPPVVSSE